MKLNKIIAIFVLIALFSCNSSKEIAKSKVPKKEIQKNTTPKNVILLIADGTGLTQVSTAFYFKESDPNYGRFKHIGLINTSS